MSDQVILEYVAQAEAAAASVKDKELKFKTFELVLAHLLNGSSSGSSKSPDQTNTPMKQPRAIDSDDPMQKLAQWADVDVEAISDLMGIEDNQVKIHLPSSVLPKQNADAQRFLVLVQLAATKIAFGTSDMGAKELIATCTDYSCMDANFAKNIKAHDKYIAVKGAKGKMKVYSIRRPGLEEAAKEIKDALGEA